MRILDKDVSVKVWQNEDKIEKNYLRTCGFCYKVFARIKGRKLHELMEDNSYDETPAEEGRFVKTRTRRDFNVKHVTNRLLAK